MVPPDKSNPFFQTLSNIIGEKAKSGDEWKRGVGKPDTNLGGTGLT